MGKNKQKTTTPPTPVVATAPPTPAPQVVTMSQEDFDALMAKADQIDRIVAAIQGSGKKNGRGGKHQPQPVLDTKTGVAYRTKSAAGIAVAPEYGLPVHNFVWYELVKGTKNKPAKCPNRFEEITQEDYEARNAKQTAPAS